MKRPAFLCSSSKFLSVARKRASFQRPHHKPVGLERPEHSLVGLGSLCQVFLLLGVEGPQTDLVTQFLASEALTSQALLTLEGLSLPGFTISSR